MCGIAGYIGNSPLDESVIRTTLSLMRNRGPDHQAHINFDVRGTHITLFSARLSIIDLEKRSNQPFTIGDYTMVYNGEIYNYVELREELVKRKVNLRTSSDTEVLLQYYILFGERCVDYFEGMWSFAIFDQKKKTIFLSRDRFGEKPLYYFRSQGGFYFGSEIKFIKSLSRERLRPNTQHLLRYLVNGYKALYKVDETFFEDVKEIPLGSNGFVSLDGKFETKKYWHPLLSEREMSLEEAIDGFKSRFFESVKIRLRSDVPIAFCLSGGVDSSAIVSVASKKFGADVQTFSIIDPDERYNEYENIKATIDDLKCKHTVVHLVQENFFNRLEKLIRYHDSPLYTISYYVHSYLSEAIGNAGYRVVLSGTGADEFLTGYYDHFVLYLHEIRNSGTYPSELAAWEKHIKPLVRNPYLNNPSLYSEKGEDFREHIYLDRGLFLDCLRTEFSEKFIEEKYSNSLLRNRMLNELFHESILPILHEDDLNSMLFSIENRSPYLDSRLLEFCYSIPTRHLIHDGYAKYILREALRGILNDKVRLTRKKVGFNASIHSVLDLKDETVKKYILSDSPIWELVNRDKIKPILSKHPLPDSYNKFIFNLLNAKMFLELEA